MERTDKIQEILKSQYEQDYLNVLGEKKKRRTGKVSEFKSTF